MKLKRQRVKVQDVIVIPDEDLPPHNDLPSEHAVWGFLHPVDAVQQIACLKQVSDEIMKADTITESNIYCTDVLIEAFFVCPIKNPTKRVVASCLQKVSCKEAYDTLIKSNIAQHLRKHLHYLQGEHGDLEGIQHMTENISILLENFPVGEEALMLTKETVVIFLINSLSKFHLKIRLEKEDPVCKSDFMHCILRIVKNITKYFPKIKHVFSTDNLQTLRGSCKQLMQIVTEILVDDTYMMDCRVTCGMAVPVMFKVLAGDNYIKQVLCLFQNHLYTGTGDLGWLLSDLDLTWRNELDALSQLCLLNGCLCVTEDADLMTDLGHNSYLLSDVLPVHILSLLPSLTDSNKKLMAARTLVQWTVKTRSCLLTAEIDPELVQRLRGDGELMKQVMQFACNNWQDPNDAIRHHSVTIFENVVKCHILTTNNRCTDYKEDAFLCDLAKSLLALDWSNKGKYEPLSALIDFLTATHLLTLNPDLPKVILAASGENTVASYANELFEKLLTSHKRELSLVEDVDPDLWNNTWVGPLVDAVSSTNKNLKHNILQYTIPKVLKCCPESVIYIKEKLTSSKNYEQSVGTLVTCLKRAKMMGIMKMLPQSVGSMTGSLPVSLLRHPDEQVRLDVYGLLCESIKTTEVVAQSDLQLIQQFLPLNLSSQNPAFRQQLTAYSKKLFIRIKESSQPLVKARKADSTHEAQAHLNNYQVFIEWLVDMLLDNVHQGAAFPSRTTALSIFSTLVSIFQSVSEKDVPWSFVLAHMTENKAQTLIECFNDTFDSNKQEAFHILKSLPLASIGLQNKKCVSELLETALDLASSTNPQECSVAAYLFKLLVRQPVCAEVILDMAGNSSKVDQPGHQS